MESKKQKSTFSIDIKTAFEVDQRLREGLAEAGLIPEVEARDIRSSKVTDGGYEVVLDLDPKTAAALSQLLREGIIDAASAHQANNNSVAVAMKKVVDGEV